MSDYEFDDLDDLDDDLPPRGMDMVTKIVLCALAGILLTGMVATWIFMARCSAFVEEATKDMDKWVTDGSYSPYRKLEAQEVEAFVRAEVEAAGGEMAGGDRRVVVINGQVSSIERKPTGDLQVVFVTPAGEARCRFLRSVTDDLTDVKEGDLLIVGGVIDWINKRTVQLKECQLQQHWQRRGRQPK